MTSFRTDIEGLRAIAVILVVGYHARLPGFHAGFIGVDIFFVISGFLITRILLEEVQATGKISLLDFWARRARRLLPAITLVLAVTGVVAALLLEPFRARAVAFEIGATALYISNLLFSARATDYFADKFPSPLLHTWTLGVEEQFYFFLPVLLTVVARLFRSRVRDSKHWSTTTLGALTAASFLGSLLLWNTPFAFFGLPSRAWEFGFGACLAAVFVEGARISLALSKALTTIGSAILLAACFFVDEQVVFPGVAALLPVLGTAALIAGGSEAKRTFSFHFLSLSPMQWIGRLSYSLYLWHWPVLVFSGEVLGEAPWVRIAAILVSILLAFGTQHLVENPIRFHPRLAARSILTLRLAAGLMLLSGTVAALVLLVNFIRLQDPFLKKLEFARQDRPSLQIAKCGSPDLGALEKSCAFGVTGRPIDIMLVGDSHALHWAPALDALSKRLRWRGVAYLKGNCPAVNVNISRTTGCDAWQDSLMPLVRQALPRLLVVSNASSYPSLGWIAAPDGRTLSTEEQAAEWQSGVEQLVEAVEATGIKLAWIQDIPRFKQNPLSCLHKTRNPTSCASTEDDLLSFIRPGRLAEFSAFRRLSADGLIDPLPFFCRRSQCPVVQDGTVVYMDTNHMTATFSRSLSRSLETSILDVVGATEVDSKQ